MFPFRLRSCVTYSPFPAELLLIAAIVSVPAILALFLSNYTLLEYHTAIINNNKIDAAKKTQREK